MYMFPSSLSLQTTMLSSENILKAQNENTGAHQEEPEEKKTKLFQPRY